MEQENSLIPEEEIKNPEILETSTNDEPVVAESKAVENAKEKKEVPEIDFSILSTEEIIRQAQKLINDYPVVSLKEIFEGLPEIFESRYKEEYEKALAIFTADGDKPEDFEYKNDNRERFNALYKLYKDKKNATARQTEAEREENLKIKLGIIEELKALVQKEEALDKTFQEFRDLQERWRNTGMVPQGQLNGLLETYHHHVENFYNYIKINKELRDLDLKRNLDAKNALCEEAEKLVENNDIAGAFKQLQLLHSRWKEIGPIPKEQKEPLWERFKAATSQINEKYHHFFESLKQEQEDNLKVKEEICGKAAAIAAGEYRSISEWNTATQNIIDLQEEWKHSGTIPQKERNKIYKKFRSSCDTFFERKRDFYKNMSAEQDKNLELKIKLCEKVEAIKDSTDWKATADELTKLQKEWKTIGPVAKKYSDAIWKRFISACDYFFEQKNKATSSQRSVEVDNLNKKKEIIEKLGAIDENMDTNEATQLVRELMKEWNSIGHVPFKEKDRLYKQYHGQVDKLFDHFNISAANKKLSNFKSNISNIQEGSPQSLYREREKLVRAADAMRNELQTYENNLGFLTASSKKGNSLLTELNRKVEKLKADIELVKQKIKVIDDSIRSAE